MNINQMIRQYTILVPLLISKTLFGGEPGIEMRDMSEHTHHHQHVEDHYDQTLQEKKYYEEMERKNKESSEASEAEKEKLTQEQLEQENKNGAIENKSSIDMSEQSKSKKTSTLSTSVEDAQEKRVKTTFDKLADYFAKPFRKDLKRLIASSIAHALRNLLLKLLRIHHDLHVTTAPLDMLKVKAELATEKKDKKNADANIDDTVDAIKNFNTFLLDNERYSLSTTMQNNINESTTLSSKIARILKMTSSSASTTSATALTATENLYAELLKQVEEVSADTSTTSLPDTVAGSTGLIETFKTTWKLFETTPGSSDSVALTYAASMTLTSLMQISYAFTEFVMGQSPDGSSTSSIEVYHPVDDLSNDYFAHLLDDLIVAN